MTDATFIKIRLTKPEWDLITSAVEEYIELARSAASSCYDPNDPDPALRQEAKEINDELDLTQNILSKVNAQLKEH
jgi:hypothetical protein